MKRQYYLLIASYLILLNNNAQSTYDLEANNIRARINNNIHLFSQNEYGLAGFESISHNDVGSIFNSSLWLVGELPNGQLAVAAEKFYDSTAIDYQCGPVGDSYNSVYERVYPIKKSEIDEFVSWYSCSQNANCDHNSTYPNYTIPTSILDWPAHGDVSNHEAFNLAPFVDVDGNGWYNPLEGDYPKIKGDEAVYFILNDKNLLHTASGGTSIGAELHVMVYAFQSSINAIDNTIFVNYSIFNRGKNNYTNFKIGTYVDIDLGCAANDYIGCDTNRNLFYGYNKYPVDIANPGVFPCVYGFSGAPSQSVMFLNKKMERFNYFGNSNSFMSDPYNGIPEQFHQSMSSLWKDGSPLYYGGNGHASSAGVTTNLTDYAFPDFPSANVGWSQMSLGETDMDVRALGVIEENNFNSGDVICFDLAYTFNFDSSLDNIGNVSQLLVASDQVQNFYDNNELGCSNLLTRIKEEEDLQASVFPNPFSETTTINFNHPIEDGQLNIYNSVGQLVRTYHLNKLSEVIVEKQDLNNGIYLFTLTGSRRQFYKGKIIVR